MRTINDLLKEAIQVQSACNLHAVVNSFFRAITDLKLNGVEDSEAINKHPVSVLYADKIRSLTNCDRPVVFANAYDEAFAAADAPSPMLNVAQERALKSLCERYDVDFKEEHYTFATASLVGLPSDYVAGWVGGEQGRNIFIGCAPDGAISS
jgi:hypothetical protein